VANNATASTVAFIAPGPPNPPITQVFLGLTPPPLSFQILALRYLLYFHLLFPLPRLFCFDFLYSSLLHPLYFLPSFITPFCVQPLPVFPYPWIWDFCTLPLLPFVNNCCRSPLSCRSLHIGL
jgi:hypothetical protein